MKNNRKPARTGLLVVLSLVTVMSLSSISSATGNIVKSDLTGTWQIALRGNTGCGFSSMLANVTMNTAGVGTGTLLQHGQCGDSSVPGQTFTIQTLATNGSGTANLTCGIGCGWNLKIQVSPDRSKINLVDISAANPGNFVEGSAILASPAGNVSIPDLTGSWQTTLYAVDGCGNTSTLVTFALNSSGVANNATETQHSAGCGDNTSTGNTMTIQSLNSDGSGTANLSCGLGCGWNFNIQVSPDRSTFNLIDVSSVNPGNFPAGLAVRNSSAGNISVTNLAGPWLVSLYGLNGCGDTATSVKFTLNASGVATNATETRHSAGCGNNTSTGNTMTIQSLNPDGSGTANLSCGVGCGWNFNIQVSPDRSTFNLADVSAANPGNFLSGVGIHQ